MKVKKGDEVVVIAGKDRGIKGKVLEADPVTNKVIDRKSTRLNSSHSS